MNPLTHFGIKKDNLGRNNAGFPEKHIQEMLKYLNKKYPDKKYTRDDAIKELWIEWNHHITQTGKIHDYPEE